MQRIAQPPANNTRHEKFTAAVLKLLATTAAHWMDSTQSAKIQTAASHHRPAAHRHTFGGIGLLHPRNSSETGAGPLPA